MYEYGPSVKALQSKSQELSSFTISPRLGLYSRPGSNCIRTKTWSVGCNLKSWDGLVMTYLLLEASHEDEVSLNLMGRHLC